MIALTPEFKPRNFLAPRYWPVWLGLGLMRAGALLPYPLLLALGKSLGLCMYALMPWRRRVAQANIALCFPELDASAQQRLLRDSFVSAGIALLETGLSWWGSAEKLKHLYRFEGEEHLQRALEDGKGVFLLGAHYTTLEISGRLLAFHTDALQPVYKPAHNRLFNAVMVASRRRLFDALLRNNDFRAILRNLKEGKVVWYAPDQDFGPENTIFAPFMGVQTASLTMTTRLARSTGAPVLPFFSQRLPGTRGYLIRCLPPLEDFPSGDDVRDATRVNQMIEQHVRLAPEQYLWMHRRFKTRPAGEPPRYPRRHRKHKRADARALSPHERRVTRRHNAVLAALAVPLIGHALYQALRGGGRRHLAQRLGFGYPQLPPGSLWLHAATVDDLVAAVPLLDELRARHAGVPLVVTTTTPAGAHAAAVRLPAEVTHVYLPVDYREAAERFLDAVRPRCALVMATEPRLNLYRACHERNVPVLVIDGHVTPDALHAPQWLREHDAAALNSVRAVLARTDQDRARFVELGVDAHRIEVIGDIRFAPTARADPGDSPLPRAYVLAAATHADEERRIAGVWKEVRGDKPLLVIAPLLPQRCGALLPQLDALQLNVAVRGRRDEVTAQTDVYLVDTVDELDRFVAHADFVFMGGSLVNVGGHDVLEPARAGKAVIFGPHVENFADEARALRDADAAVQVRDELELRTTLARLLASPQRQQAMGERGRELVAGQDDVARRYCDAIARHLVTDSAPGAAPGEYQQNRFS